MWHVAQLLPLVPRLWKKGVFSTIGPAVLYVETIPVGSRNGNRLGITITAEATVARHNTPAIIVSFLAWTLTHSPILLLSCICIFVPPGLSTKNLCRDIRSPDSDRIKERSVSDRPDEPSKERLFQTVG